MAGDARYPYATFAEGDDLALQAKPLADPAEKRAFGDVKLPPEDLLDELDNSKVKASPAEDVPDEPVTLDFFGDDLPFKTFRLKHPFTWRDRDIRVEEVEVHQLTTAEVGDAVRDQDAGVEVRLFELYARMTRVKGTDVRLTPAVLRKMPNVDGSPIVGAAYDFLPLFFRPAAG